MGMSNIELARQGFNAAARGDFDAIGELLDPQVKWHGGDPTAAGSCQNRQQAVRWMRAMATRRGGPLPDLIEVVDAPPDRVVVIMRVPGAPHDPAAQTTANVATFRGGKVVEMVHFADAADALASVASAPRPG